MAFSYTSVYLAWSQSSPPVPLSFPTFAPSPCSWSVFGSPPTPFAVNIDRGVLVRCLHHKAAHVALSASFTERWSHYAQPTAEGFISLRLETHRDCLGFYTGNPSLPIHPFVKSCISGWRMAQWVRVFFAKHDDLSLTPGIHVVEKTNSCKQFSDLHTCSWHMCGYICTHTHTK